MTEYRQFGKKVGKFSRALKEHFS